jgi:2-polyprenyl-3-methyl-5-hydroxy-6-metoxy-1,4-benzoquinol methylase
MIIPYYEEFEDKKNCPLCGSSKVSSVLAQPSWEIEQCLVCHNAWTIPAPKIISYDAKDFHFQFNYSDVSDLPKQWQKSVLMQVELLARYLRPKAKILEIGCGVGISLKEISQRGFKVCGIEPSITASQRGRETGMNIITGYFPDVDLSESFDAVIMAHVLEHIPEPYNFLKKVAMIAPGGSILIVQSNCRGLMPRIQKENWHAWVPEHHFWHFTSKGLVKMLNSLHWKVLKIEYSSLSHGNGIISRIGSVIPRMGDQMHVIASIPTRSAS